MGLKTRRAILTGLWILSLVGAGQIGATAQRYDPHPPAPGSEIRFVQSGRSATGLPQGQLMAVINGQWTAVTLEEFQGGIVPAR
jgi:hypothetical protein